jgi:peptidoglycan hydrolase-like protein with peptidoglycan-binding domain
MARRKKKSAMTASTLSNLSIATGSAVASTFGRAGAWAFSRYMRAPLASTALLAMVTMTALAGSNALYFQTSRHPAPFFSLPSDVPTPVTSPMVAPVPAAAPQQRTGVLPAVEDQTTGSVGAPQPQVQPLPDQPVGNREAFDVQKKLMELGLFEGKVDGFYGPMTARAIRAFEERNGLEPSGALTPAIVDAIMRADAGGRMPVAQAPIVAPPVVQAAPQPVVQQALVQPAPQPAPVAAPQPMPQAALPQDRPVAQLPALTPVDNAVDSVGTAAAETIDSIVAAVGGGPVPAARQSASVPALPMLASSAQPMPPPVQVASLEPMRAPAPAAQTAPDQSMAANANVAPANNLQLVTQIQRGLASLGFYHGSIDGHPGDATAKAIREFENFHSYKVTGQIKPDLVGLLRDAGAAI